MAKKALEAKEEELRLGRELLQTMIRAQKEKEDRSRSRPRRKEAAVESEYSYSEGEPERKISGPRVQAAFHKPQRQSSSAPRPPPGPPPGFPKEPDRPPPPEPLSLRENPIRSKCKLEQRT